MNNTSYISYWTDTDHNGNAVVMYQINNKVYNLTDDIDTLFEELSSLHLVPLGEDQLVNENVSRAAMLRAVNLTEVISRVTSLVTAETFSKRQVDGLNIDFGTWNSIAKLMLQVDSVVSSINRYRELLINNMHSKFAKEFSMKESFMKLKDIPLYQQLNMALICDAIESQDWVYKPLNEPDPIKHREKLFRCINYIVRGLSAINDTAIFIEESTGIKSKYGTLPKWMTHICFNPARDKSLYNTHAWILDIIPRAYQKLRAELYHVTSKMSTSELLYASRVKVIQMVHNGKI